MNGEKNILAKLRRRLRSARGTVFLEFAVVAPMAVGLVVFAADFTSILFAEQQTEICARATADIESHMNHFMPVNATPAQLRMDGPGRVAKTMVKPYLAEVLGLDGAKAGAFVYCKGETKPVPGIAHMFSYVNGFFDGTVFKNTKLGIVGNIFGRIFGGALSLITLGTHAYLLEIPAHDRLVRMSVSVRVPTLMPRRLYAFFSCPGADRREGVHAPWSLVAQFRNPYPDEQVTTNGVKVARGAQWTMEPDFSLRERYYCTMPLLDTVPVPPRTFVMKMSSVFGKSVPQQGGSGKGTK